MKTILLDLAASLIFLAVYLATSNIALATAVGMAWGVAHTVWLLHTGQTVMALQWVGLALVVVLGTATLLTRNPVFVMLKPTLIQAGIAATLLKPGWMARYLSETQRARVPCAAVVRAGYLHPAGLTVLAILNLALALWATPRQWAVFHSVATTGVFVVLGLAVWVYLRNAAVQARQTAPA